jgi:hypothetical protein
MLRPPELAVLVPAFGSAPQRYCDGAILQRELCVKIDRQA